MPGSTPAVVIVGGGFGGLYAALSLHDAPVRVTLIDRRNFHLFQPLLYQVATGGLSPANIAAPLRAILRRQANTEVLLAEVTGIELAGRRVLLREGDAVDYDTLVVSAGARHHYFGRPDWEPSAPGLKTIEDATEIRRRILTAFESAERAADVMARQAHLTFVIVGGGPTGVELAGAISELARHTLRRNFRRINPAEARVLLVEGADRVLPPYPADLSTAAEKSLRQLGVEVWTQAKVSDIQPHAVTIQRSTGTEVVPASTVLWAAGVLASPLGKLLADATGAEIDRAGRITVQPDLTLPGHPEIFVIGDMALATGPDGKPLPGIAPVAMQQGRYAANCVRQRIRREPIAPFRFFDRGMLATIGRASAVGLVFGRHVAGWVAWMAWLFIHLMYLMAFENRLLVLIQWGGNYFTRNRSARLITGESADQPKGK
ncbi:MAG: NAD(P)/FAD-dependent oxidoreductase [Gemmataceae bacterium]